MELQTIGRSLPRVDGIEKVTGRANYTDDFKASRMLFAKILRSPYPHAMVLGIDASRARKLAGVKAVLTGADVPDEKLGISVRDRFILARDVVRFVGEPVAAVAADTVDTAEEALDLIEVDYKELPAIFDVEEAMKSDPAVAVHEGATSYVFSPGPQFYGFDRQRPNVFAHYQMGAGDTEKGMREADLIVENRFVTPRIHHGAMEPHAAIAQVEFNGGLTVWVADQVAHHETRAELCRVFGLPPSKLRVIVPYIGGGFGGKTNSAWPAPVAMLLALKTGRPVRLVFSREEVFVDGLTEVPMVLYIKDGVKKDGTLVAREMRVILNSGAYSNRIPRMTANMSFGAAGLYRMPYFRWDSFCVMTNEPPSGPMRGYGGTPLNFAIESQMDMIARELGIDPAELRQKHIFKEGEKNLVGGVTECIGAAESLTRVSKWIEERKTIPPEKGPWRSGTGVAVVGKIFRSGGPAAALVKVHDDGTVEVRHSASESGQGCNTVMAQVAAEEFGISMDGVKVVFSDSAVTPYDVGSIASRSTWNTGHAVRLACQDAKRQIFRLAAQRLKVPAESLEIKGGRIYVRENAPQGIQVHDLFVRDGLLTPGTWLLEAGEILGSGVYAGASGRPGDEKQQRLSGAVFAYGAVAVSVAVNVETGEVRVLKAASGHDMGQPINPRMCEAQMDGGVGMGVGAALYETMAIENGVTINPNLVDYKLPTMVEVPVGEDAASMLVTTPLHKDGPYGAKGFGESTNCPVAPAIANAVYDAVGVRIKSLPITREKILEGLSK
ncbi:MAG: coxL [Dehalococcoidia bacterium]|nr:coxL [Dehalococcoidia bacterium]